MSAAQIGNVSAAGQAPSAPASPPVSPLAVSPPLSKHSQHLSDIPTLHAPQSATFLAAARNLDSLGFAMNEKVIAFTIIMALPESLHTLKMILCSLKGDDLSIDNVIGQIYLDESCRVRASGSTAVTFFAKAAKKRGKADSKDKKKCTHCKRKGHDVS